MLAAASGGVISIDFSVAIYSPQVTLRAHYRASMSDLATIDTDLSRLSTTDPLLCIAIAPVIIFPVSLPSLTLFSCTQYNLVRSLANHRDRYL